MTGISIDFLPVGEGAKNGDALTIQYGSDYAKQVMVIDGGTRSAGTDAVAHIKQYYGTNTAIEHVVCSHQDADHSSGLRDILEAFPVRNLWVHQPWLYAEELVHAFRDRWSVEGLRRHLRNEAFPIVADLCDIAESLGVPLREPFQGATIGPFTVLAPSRTRLLAMIPVMDQTPSARALETTNLLEKALGFARNAVLSVFEGWGVETLRDPTVDSTSATNESSVVLLGAFDGGNVLLTADGGVGALQEAIDGAARYGLTIGQPAFMQIPHHGSRRNVGPAILDQILGPKLEVEGYRRGSAVSSVSAGCEIMPRKAVENAFTRRGYGCNSTKGNWINYTLGLTPRAGLMGLPPAPLHSLVED